MLQMILLWLHNPQCKDNHLRWKFDESLRFQTENVNSSLSDREWKVWCYNVFMLSISTVIYYSILHSSYCNNITVVHQTWISQDSIHKSHSLSCDQCNMVVHTACSLPLLSLLSGSTHLMLQICFNIIWLITHIRIFIGMKNMRKTVLFMPLLTFWH